MVYEYEDYEVPRAVSRDEVNRIIALILEPGTGMVQTIVNGVKLILVFVFVMIRRSMLDEEKIARRNIYSQKREQKNESTLEGDDLDAARRP